MKKYDARWLRRLAELRAYVNKHGKSSPLKDDALGRWATRQRYLRRLGRLSQKRIRKLDAIEFSWPTPTHKRKIANWANWAERITRLRAFRSEHRHCQVPIGYHDHELARLVSYCRRVRRRGRLPAERIAELDSIGFDWQPTRDHKPKRDRRDAIGFEPRADRPTKKADAHWDRRFAELRAHGKKYGKRSPLGGSLLGKWATDQRWHRRLGRLSDERIRKLDAIGFDWKPRDSIMKLDVLRWDRRFAELVAYGKKHGRNSSLGDSLLGKWATYQRWLRRLGQLSDERIRRLDAIGFSWSPARNKPANWAERVARLQAFRKKHGHFDIPCAHPDRELVRLVEHSRYFRRHGKLPAERVAELDAIGFDWKGADRGLKVADLQWDRRFAEFRAHWKKYRKRDQRKGGALGHWWGTRQRQLRRLGRLGDERIRRLDAIGFDW